MFGFHISPQDYAQGLGDWMKELDAAGIPFCIKGADYAGPVFEGQQLAQVSGVPHVLIYRKSGDGWDVPDYNLPPKDAAEAHWAKHVLAFPPELDPSMVWMENINEVDKNRSDWLGRFAYHTGVMALNSNRRCAAFGFASGEPEPGHWETPGMLKYLRLAAAYPNRLAVSLHEYSYEVDDIWYKYPYHIGRFQKLFDTCDAHGLGRPTVLITEWGWCHNDLPSPEQAMVDVGGIAAQYVQYPSIKGVALWHLGGGYNDIKLKAQKLIAPMKDFAINAWLPPPPPQPDLLKVLPRRLNVRSSPQVNSDNLIGSMRRGTIIMPEERIVASEDEVWVRFTGYAAEKYDGETLLSLP